MGAYGILTGKLSGVVMRYLPGKAISVLLASLVMFSMSGCLELGGMLKSTKNSEAIDAAIKENNFVEEWTGEIPSGMKIEYVLVKEQKVNDSDTLHENVYEYDGSGRRTVVQDNREKGYLRYEKTYDNSGYLVAKKQIREGTIPGAPLPNIDMFFVYDEKGKLVRYTEKRGEDTYEYRYQYDLDGHLIAVSDSNNEVTKYDSDFTDQPCYEYVAVVNDEFDDKGPVIVKRTYGEYGQMLTEETSGSVKTYEYSGGKLTGYTRKNVSMTTKYDLNDHVLQYDMSGGKEVRDYEYNDQGDLIRYKLTREGEVRYKSEHVIEYNSDGKKTSDTANIWNKSNDGKESTSVQMTVYTYDDHGLLIREEETKNGKIINMSVYYYKAVLVPDDKE